MKPALALSVAVAQLTPFVSARVYVKGIVLKCLCLHSCTGPFI